MIYLVDFENVTSAGISGIQKLTKDDKVYIFYTVNASTLSFAAHLNLLSSPAEIIYYNVASGGKNALDFQLASFLGYLINQGKEKNFCIISNDKGYEYVKAFWERNGLVGGISIHSAPSINRSLIPAERPFAAKIQQNVNDHEQIGQTENAPHVNKFPEASSPAVNDEQETEDVNITDNTSEVPEIVGEDAPEEDTNVPVTEKTDEVKEISEQENLTEEKPAPKKRGRPKGKKTTAAEETQTAVPEKIEGPAYDALSALIEKGNIPAGDKEKSEIMGLLGEAGGKQHFYRGLLTVFGMEKGVEVYKILRPEYTNLTKLIKQ